MDALFCLGLIIVAVIVTAILGDKRDRSAGVNASANGDSGGFLVRARLIEDAIKGHNIRFIGVEIRGTMIGPHDGWSTRFTVALVDHTDGDLKPVFCFVPGLAMEGATTFMLKTVEQCIPYRFARIDHWVEICRIPVDYLVFPARGKRRINVAVQVGDDYCIAGATTWITVDIAGRGYEEEAANQRRIDQITVELAMAVSAADGSLDDEEAEIVRGFVRTRIEAASAEEAEEVKQELNDAVRCAADTLSDDRVAELCRELMELTDQAQRYAVLNLGLRIAGIDQRADIGELRVLDSIARNLEVDMKRFKDMMDKALPIQFHEENSPETLLGLEQGMSDEEIHRRLNKEFRKWNPRATHRDPRIREQAQQMITLISEIRRARWG